MSILKTNELSFKSVNAYNSMDGVAHKVKDVPQQATSSTPISSRSGQRRLRAENSFVAMVKADRPADDLQAVYEKYKNRPFDSYYHTPSMEHYFVRTGDIESVKVLEKYGAIFTDPSYLGYALTNLKHQMVRFLVDRGSVLPMDQWLAYVKMNEGGLPYYKNTSEEWISIFEYLLDHGTKVNINIRYEGLPLQHALKMQSSDPADGL